MTDIPLIQDQANTGTTSDDFFTINFGSGTLTTVSGLAGDDTITSIVNSTGFVSTTTVQLTSIENLTFGTNSQFWFLTTAAIGTSTPTFHITGNSPDAGTFEKNWLTFNGSAAATSLDLSGLTFTNFSQSNQIVFANFSSHTSGVTLVGSTANFTAQTGSGNDTVTFTGMGINSAFLGLGTDTLIGSAGNHDTITLSGQRANWEAIQVGVNEFELNGPDGTKHVTNVEFAFFIGESVNPEFAIADLVGHATITYVLSNAPHLLPSTVLNPASLLSSSTTDTLFQLDVVPDDPGGTAEGYSIKIIGHDFAYDGSNEPTGGTITQLLVQDSNGDTYVIIDGPFANSSLSAFYNKLYGPNPTDGAKAALDQLIGNNCIQLGSPGADQMESYGTGGTMDGKAGADQLHGGDGSQTMIGGTGRDIMTGGADRDLFAFNAIKDSLKGSNRDQILDFKHGDNVTGDDIDLRTIDAKSKVGGNQAFKFIGKQDFHDVKGELRYIDKGASCIVQGDVNGDGKADFEIFVKIGSLAKGDFLL